MKFKITGLIYLAVALVGIYFLIKLWLPSGYVVAGHDSGLALNASEFLKTRLFAWDPQGFGRDNSTNFGSLVIHFIDYVWSVFSGIASAGNQLSLFYWLAIIFSAAFVFAYQLKEKLGKYFVFLFPVFVTFNFYILQSIFMLERAKYSLLAASLLFLTITFKFQERKFSVLFAGILSSLVLLFFNSGSWFGLPLYGSFFVLVLSLVIFEIIGAISRRKYSDLFRLVGYLSVTAVGFIILNAYSIFPYIAKFLKQDVFTITNSAVIAQNKAWLENISQATSFLNVFRLQGVPDWYSSSTSISLVHSYANNYLSNPIYVIFSFVFPLLIITPFILAKTKEQKKLISFVGLAMLLAMFFMAGSHKPLGFVYEFIYDNLPGFSIFRSPYYKFGVAFFICASILMAFTLSALIEKVTARLTDKVRSWVGVSITVFLIMGWFGYHSVIFSSDNVFSWQKGLTTRLKVPEYVNSFSLWANNTDLKDSRILLVPPINKSWQNDAYNWGYWSLTNLPSVISNQSFVAGDGLTGGEGYWVDKLYSFIKEGKEKEVYDLSYRLGIDYLFLRRDVLSDSSWSATLSPEIYEKILDGFTTIKKVNSFDQWLVYKFDRELTPKFKIATSLIGIPGGCLYLAQELLPNQETIYVGEGDDQRTPYLSKVVETYSCLSCLLAQKDALTSLPKVRILPNSPLYYFKLRRESGTLKVSNTEQSKIDSYLGFSVRRAAEIGTMLNLGLKDKYSTEALKIMNGHLEELYKLLQVPTDPGKYFFRARRLLDNINVIDRRFKDEVASSEFWKREQDFRREIIDVLWNIKELRNLFPIIYDRQVLETNKIYYLRFPDENNYQIFLDPSSLPRDTKGQFILPDDILYKTKDEELHVSLEELPKNLLRLKLPTDLKNGEIIFKFLKHINLLEIQGTSIEESISGTLSGKRSCLVGKIKDYSSAKRYKFEIKVSKGGQSLRMYIKDIDSKKGKSNYIYGQSEEDVIQFFSSQPFSYLYYPSAGSKDSTIYLCSSDLNMPVIDDFKISEVFSPNIISIKSVFPKSLDNPNINFEKINPISYKISINSATKPFILMFNEAYNPFWKIKGEDFEHFMINGYANAWLVDKKGSFDLVLGYRLQKYFYFGSVVSAIGLISAIMLAVYLKKKEKR